MFQTTIFDSTKVIYISLANKTHVVWIMKGWVIFLIHLSTAVNFIIVPDLHQMNTGLYHHK